MDAAHGARRIDEGLKMATTHIEVLDDKGHGGVKTGQLLEVVRETACFIWVRGFNGTEYQVSKRTKRINGTASSFIKTASQPLVNL
jgi:hypothetical protein